MYSFTILLFALRTMTALIVAATELLAESSKSLLILPPGQETCRRSTSRRFLA
jgi:hypothetical protein